MKFTTASVLAASLVSAGHLTYEGSQSITLQYKKGDSVLIVGTCTQPAQIVFAVGSTWLVEHSIPNPTPQFPIEFYGSELTAQLNNVNLHLGTPTTAEVGLLVGSNVVPQIKVALATNLPNPRPVTHTVNYVCDFRTVPVTTTTKFSIPHLPIPTATGVPVPEDGQ